MSATKLRTVKAITEDMAAVNEDLESIEKKTRGRNMTSEEQLEYNRLQTKFDDLDFEFKRAERYRQRKGEEVDRRNGITPNKRTGRKTALAYGMMELGSKRATNVSQANFPEIIQQRAFDTTDGVSMIPDQRILEKSIFDPLTSGPVEQLGMDVITGIANHTSRVVWTGYPAAQVVAEGTQIPESTAVATAKTFNFVNIDINMPVTADTIRDADINVYGDVATLFAESIQNEVLRQVTKGTSASGEMVGLDNATGVQSLSHSSATLTYDPIVTAVRMAMAKNAQRENLRVLMNPTAWQQLQMLKDTTGQQIEMPEGLRDIPFVVHTSIANDYGAGNDETRVYVGDFSTVKLGVGGTYDLTTQHLKADFDIVNFIMVYRCDMQLMFPDHIVRIEDVATA